MARNGFRQGVKKMLLRWMDRPGEGLGGPAVVFAPHQDDETLGCGGTIIQKTRAGWPVWVVFLTDGGRSHSKQVAANVMKNIRAQEARSACRVLGVPAERVLFLDFPNGALHQHRAEACARVQDLLRETGPAEVYIPSVLDFHSEHRVTAEVVTAAIQGLKVGAPIGVYEYPVWFWYQWPWVGLLGGNSAERRRERSQLLRRALRYGCGLALPAQFRRVVPIRDVLEVKRAALDEYASQMAAPEGAAGWQTLEDVGGGEFVDCFFHDFEVFRPVKP